MSTAQQFTWESYFERFDATGGDFDLFQAFTFDHLSDGEVQEIIETMQSQAALLKKKAAVLRRQNMRAVK